MWDNICLQNICRRTYTSASRPTGLDGMVVLIDGYDDSYGLIYSNTVTLISRGKIKQLKANLI